jgi:hypothetical protein
MAKFFVILALLFASTATAQLPITQKNPAVFQQGVTLSGGNLTLFQDPTQDMHACTKQYVDDLADLIAGISELTGDVSASGVGSVAATVNQVGGYSAANVASGATLANAATSSNTNNAIVRRNGSGGFTAGAITATTVDVSGELTAGSIHTANVSNNAIVSGTLTALTGSQFVGAAQFDDAVTVTGNITANGQLKAAASMLLDVQTDAASTGSNAAITPSKPTVILTNASLSSIGSIASPLAGEVQVLTNKTGAAITLVNEYTSATAANRIVTGTGADLSIASDASIQLVYNSNNSRWQVVGGTGSGSGSSGNLLTNGGFELGSSSWTASGGTFGVSTTPTPANVYEPSKSAQWDSNSAAQTLTSAAIAVGGRAGTNGEFSCWIKTPSGTATYLLEVYDGTNVTASQSIASSSTYAQTIINSPFPSSTSVYIRIKSVASNEPEIFIDDCYVGVPRNLSNVSVDTDPQSYSLSITATGGGAAMGTPTLNTATWWRDGKFMHIRIAFGKSSGTGSAGTGTYLFSIPSGYTIDSNYVTYVTNPSGAAGNNVGTASATNTTSGAPTQAAGQSFTVAYDSTHLAIVSSNSTALTNSFASSAHFDLAGTVYYSIDATVPIVGWSAASSQVYNPPFQGQFWSGYLAASSATTTSTSQAELNTSGLSITQLTNQNFPTVSARGSNYGLTFTPTKTGIIEVCWAGSIGNNTNGHSMGIGLYDGSGNAISTPTYVVMAAANQYITSGNCGYLNVTSISSQTVGFRGVVSAGTGAIGSGQQVMVTMKYLNQGYPAPVVIGSVTSTASNPERLERATITCSGTSSALRQSGSWISSVGNVSSNRCTVTIASGIFSDVPTCVATRNDTSTTSTAGVAINVVSATSFTIGVVSNTGGTTTASSNEQLQVLCMGPR